MKKYIWIFLILFLLIPPFMASIAPKNAVSMPKTEVKSIEAEKPTVEPKTAVLGVNNDEVPFYTMGSNTVTCAMPDGKTILSTKADCDRVNDFWDKHKPSNPTASNDSGSSSNSNSNNSNNEATPTPTVKPTEAPTPTPTIAVPTPTPTPAVAVTVDTITAMPCGSTSCGGYRTIRVTGTNFTSDAVFELTAWGNTYGKNTSINHSPDAMVTGGNGLTEIIMDYYSLPCNPNGYGFQVVFSDGRKVIAPTYFAILCSQ